MAKKTSSVGSTDTSGKALIPEYRTSSGRTVCLTFDDGPHPVQTDRVLKTLAKYGIKATFFMVGQNVAANPNVVKELRRRVISSATTLITTPISSSCPPPT